MNLYPRTSVDNIVIAVGSTASALATTISGGTAASDQKIPTEKAVSTALAGKAASSHTHTIANVTGLQTALDGKLSSVPDATTSAKGAVKVSTAASNGVIEIMADALREDIGWAELIAGINTES